MMGWEQEWLDGREAWQAEIDTEPGVFAALCQMGALDVMGPADFCRWYRAHGEAS